VRGPEHYVEAERAIAEAEAYARSPLGPSEPVAVHLLALAQAHATLAVAAAVAGERLGDEDQPWWDDSPTWSSVLAYPKQPQP
jgi:hypothetical protein